MKSQRTRLWRIVLSCLILTSFIFFVLAGPTIVNDFGTNSPPNHRAPLNYDFKVINETVHVQPTIDAGVFINYTITFENYGTQFDYIDIGFPNAYYDLSSIRAYWSLEGAPYIELTNIDPSSVIPIGVEIYVPHAQRPSSYEEGTLVVWGTNPRMVYQDTAHPGYVGYEFVPTWFDPGYCRSTDYLGVHLHFPTGFFNGTLAYYHHTQYTRYYYGTDSLVYVWEYSTHTPQAFQHGISFPYDESYITTFYTSGIEDFWAAYGDIIIIGIVIILFFSCCGACIVTSFRRGGRLRRLYRTGYLPPAVKVEALGLRRGLTVVEAAILNEVPLERVFTMVVFGLLKKDLITLKRSGKAKPTFQPNPTAIKKAGNQRGRLHYYERLFLKAITPAGNLDKIKIRTLFNTLIKTTARKLEGYSRPDTKAYYTKMISQAWDQMDKAQTPKAQARTLTDYAEWLILTPDYEDRIKHYPHYHVPTWYWWWIWASHPRPHIITGPRPTLSTPLTTPMTLTNFANATVLGTQNFANSVVTGFQTLANQIATAFRPPPPPPRRSTFSGRSCACACACVSCACACAGGGR